jgi:cysteine synthase A
MSKGEVGEEHRIQGIGDGFIPKLVNLDYLDDVLVVHDGDAILMAKKLARRLGIGVGISSGANFIGAVLAQNTYGSDFNVVTIFSDDSKKYLSSDLLKPEPELQEYLTPDIELISVDATCICDVRIKEGTCIPR